MDMKTRVKAFGVILILNIINIIIPFAHAEDIREGLVAWWSFDDCTANDSVGTSHGEIIGSAKFAPRTVGGNVGNAIILNGNNNYVTVPDSPSLNFTKAVTISLWINWDGQPGKYPGLLGKGHGGGGYSPGDYSYHIEIRKDTNILWWSVGMIGKEKQNYKVTYQPDGSRVVDNSLVRQTYEINYSPEDSEIFPSRWTYVAATFDCKNLEIYVNGQRMKSKSDYRIPSPGEWDITKAPLKIGRDGWHCFKGMIDEVRLYNRVLSSKEIEALYEIGK